MVLNSTYDAAGNRLTLSATIGGTADFVNTYSYDDLNRESQVTQGASTVTGHDAVDSKLINFTYNADGQFASIDRFNDLTGSSADRVATSTYGYDDFGRVTSLTHTAANGTTTYADDAWTYDADSQVTSFTNSANIASYADENVATYCYDHDGQLTGATQPAGQTANDSNSLSNSYDANGNATSLDGATTTTGAGNTQLFDGTYYDTYDANGSLVEQANSTNEIFYQYDNRNRVTDVTDYLFESGEWEKTEEIDYLYDLANNLIGRQDTTYESDGVTVAIQTTARNVFDPATGNMVLSFDGSGNLSNRYLWGPAVDQVLADEQFTLSGTDQLPTSAGNTLWSFDNNQQSVTDVINDAGTVEEHIAYSPFGEQTAQSTNPGSVVFVFGYTGTYTDFVTCNQLHDLRWYDPSSQRWLVQDPLFPLSGSNPYRYADDCPTTLSDPSGLIPATEFEVEKSEGNSDQEQRAHKQKTNWFNKLTQAQQADFNELKKLPQESVIGAINPFSNELLATAYVSVETVGGKLRITIRQGATNSFGGHYFEQVISGYNRRSPIPEIDEALKNQTDRDSAQAAVKWNTGECVTNAISDIDKQNEARRSAKWTFSAKLTDTPDRAKYGKASVSFDIPKDATSVKVVVVYTDVIDLKIDLAAVVASWNGKRNGNAQWTFSINSNDIVPLLRQQPSQDEKQSIQANTEKVLNGMGLGIQARQGQGPNTGYDITGGTDVGDVPVYDNG